MVQGLQVAMERVTPLEEPTRQIFEEAGHAPSDFQLLGPGHLSFHARDSMGAMWVAPLYRLYCYSVAKRWPHVAQHSR